MMWFSSSVRDLQHVLYQFEAKCEVAWMRISTSKLEAIVLRWKKYLLPVGEEILPQVEEFRFLGVLFTSKEIMEREMDRRTGVAFAVMQTLYHSVVVKIKLRLSAQLSI